MCSLQVHVQLGGLDMMVAGSQIPYPEYFWQDFLFGEAQNLHHHAVRDVARPHVIPIPGTASPRSQFLEVLVRNPNVSHAPRARTISPMSPAESELKVLVHTTLLVGPLTIYPIPHSRLMHKRHCWK